MVDDQHVSAGPYNSRQFCHGGGAQICGQVADVVRSDRAIELAVLGGQRQTITVSQPDATAMEPLRSALEEVWRKVHTHSLMADPCIGNRLQ